MSIAYLTLVVSSSENLSNWLSEIIDCSQQNIYVIKACDWNDADLLIEQYNFDAVIAEDLPVQRQNDFYCFLLGSHYQNHKSTENTENWKLPLNVKHFIKSLYLMCEYNCNKSIESNQSLAVSMLDNSCIRNKDKELLKCLLRANSGGVSKKELRCRLWPHLSDNDIHSHSLDTHLYTLRQKLTEIGHNKIIHDNGKYRLVNA